MSSKVDKSEIATLKDDEEFQKELNDLSIQSRRDAKLLITLFLLGFSIIIYIIYSFPTLDEGDRDKLMKFPRTPEDLRITSFIVKKYTESHFYHVLILFIWIYVFMQTFAIPGPLFLSILSGALFGWTKGFLLVCLVSSVGASGCYLLSSSFAKYFIFKIFPSKLMMFKKAIDDNHDNLFFFLLFLRISPLLPNWLINLASPVVGVPFKYFLFATILGLIPANIMHCYMGTTLASIEKIGFDIKILLFLLILGLFALIPVWIKKKFAKKFKQV